jgi:hypothetical protein
MNKEQTTYYKRDIADKVAEIAAIDELIYFKLQKGETDVNELFKRKNVLVDEIRDEKHILSHDDNDNNQQEYENYVKAVSISAGRIAIRDIGDQDDQTKYTVKEKKKLEDFQKYSKKFEIEEEHQEEVEYGYWHKGRK